MTHKEQADKLVEQYLNINKGFLYGFDDEGEKTAIQCAINDVTNTIKEIKKFYTSLKTSEPTEFIKAIEDKEGVLNELKARL